MVKRSVARYLDGLISSNCKNYNWTFSLAQVQKQGSGTVNKSLPSSHLNHSPSLWYHLLSLLQLCKPGRGEVRETGQKRRDLKELWNYLSLLQMNASSTSDLTYWWPLLPSNSKVIWGYWTTFISFFGNHFKQRVF